MSANRLSFEKFKNELRKNSDVNKYLFVNKMAHMCIPNTKVSKNRLLLHDHIWRQTISDDPIPAMDR